MRERPVRKVKKPVNRFTGVTAAALSVAASNALRERRRRARSNYNDYVSFVLRDNFGDPIKQADLHRTWQIHLNFCWRAGVHPGILAPWGHGKTSQLVVGLPTWIIGEDVNIRTKIVCNSDTRATERVMGIGAILRSPLYKWVFPNVRAVTAKEAEQSGVQAKWTQHDIFLHRPGFSIDPSIQAAGVLSTGIGGRCDLLIFDDVVDMKNAITNPGNRPKVIENCDEVWMSRLEPHGRLLLVGTPWHQADYTHEILKREAWCVLKQWVSSDMSKIEMEVHNPPPGYPLPAMTQLKENLKGREWVQLQSSNVSQVKYDGPDRKMEVMFSNGGHYRYLDVPRSVYEGMLSSRSKGEFLSRRVKGLFDFERLDIPKALPVEKSKGNGVITL